MLKDFISLIYPNLCAACGNSLYKYETAICTHCLYHLPKTDFYKQSENTLNKIFWGRTSIFSASAIYYFNKGAKVQNLIHELKYNGNKTVGNVLGKMHGQELIKSDHFNTIDIIIPVPLHYKKLRKRGYNQSECFAEGLSEGMQKPIDTKSLIRAKESETQTKKSRYARWQNVENIFQITNADSLVGKHILLADDVITTGSTIEACANTILKIPNTKVSVTSIAYAGY